MLQCGILHGAREVWDDEDGDGDVHLQITQKGPPQRSTGWMVVGRYTYSSHKLFRS